MQITEQTWTNYIDRLAQLNKTAARKMAEYIIKHNLADTDALIAYAAALVQKYGDGSAELACQMYDAIAEASGVSVPPAEPAATADFGEVAQMVDSLLQSPPLLEGGVGRLIKQAGADTTLKNALRDGAEFAWVPSGDTCPFCLTLASRGWQRASKKAIKNGHAEHIHAHCNCEYAIRFNSESSIAGYDPDAYLDQYNEYGGDINAMRRARYAKDKDKINAQKRAAYAKRKGQDGVPPTKAELVKTLKKPKEPATIDAAVIETEKYTIPTSKIKNYLLKDGAKHSKEFFDVGYTVDDGDLLNQDIFDHFFESEKCGVKVLEDGTERFSIFMELGKTKKKSFRTVWLKEPGKNKPRFITAYREDKK